jgi:hypothetical protein
MRDAVVMASIELVWDEGCPNVDAARANVAAALVSVGAPAEWREWRRDDPAAPEYAARHGSPAVLVDGRDVENAEATAACCRVYRDERGTRTGAPSVELIVHALRRASAR